MDSLEEFVNDLQLWITRWKLLSSALPFAERNACL